MHELQYLKKEAMKQEQSLADQIEAAEKELSDFREESAKLPEHIRAASIDADADRLAALGARSKELPIRLAASTLKLERLRLAEKESRLPELQNTFADASANAEAALTKFQQARDSMYEANGVANSVKDGVDRLQREIEKGSSLVA